MTSKKSPDEIMAEYLLKGGKMLAKTCPVCNCPLFEVKGETFCVVCREDEIEGQELVKKPVSAEKIEKKTKDNKYYLDVTIFFKKN